MTVAAPVIGPAEILPFCAAREPGKVALVVGDRRLTFRELDSLSDKVALALTWRGIGRGDVVSLYAQNGWEWVVSYHGTLKAGAVVNPVNVMLTGPELEYVLNDCKAKAIFVGPNQAATVSAVIDGVPSLELFCCYGEPTGAVLDTAVSWNDLVLSVADVPFTAAQTPATTDLCCIGYTSGTTGNPKGAMQSHQAVLLNLALTATMHCRGSDDVVVTGLPAAHVYGNGVINSTFLAGGRVVLMERFAPARALELMAAEQATMFDGVPAMYAAMIADPLFASADLSTLRRSTIGGQTFSPALIERWHEHASGPVIEVWGMTELSGMGATHALYAPPVSGSIGVTIPGMQIKIGPLDGGPGEVPTGARGKLMVRGPLVMLGYHQRPEATAEVIDAEGWLHTGDVAYADATGHFFIVDRLKDMIITAGYNVYPAEIERVLCAHPAVSMAAVGPRPDPVKGEIAIAYVVAMRSDELDDAELLAYCREHLAAYKRPREIVFVDALPTTSSGKVMRRKLSDLDPSNATAFKSI